MYMGGLERNKHESRKQKAGRATVGKTAVVGAKDRATGKVTALVVKRTDKETLQGFVKQHTAQGSKVYTDTRTRQGPTERPGEPRGGEARREGVCA